MFRPVLLAFSLMLFAPSLSLMPPQGPSSVGIPNALAARAHADVPAGWTWTVTALPGTGPPADSIACPSASLCVARSATGRSVFISRNPSGGAGAWRQIAVPAGEGPASPNGWRWPLTTVSCPSTHFCAVLAAGGRIDASGAPAKRASWSSHAIDPAHTLTALACPSTRLCVAGDDAGHVVVAANPASARNTWRLTARPGSPGIEGIYPPGPPAAPLAGMTGLSPGRVYAGATVTFWAAAHGSPEPSVRWQEAPAGTGRWTSLANGPQRDGSHVSGASQPTLAISNTQPVENGRTYRAVYRNSFGTAVTKALLLRVRSLPTGPFIAVTSGFGSACALRPTGTVVCWGSDSNGQSVPPAGRFTAISENWATVCGLKVGGAIACWGDAAPSLLGHEVSQAPPTGRFTQVSTGTGFACGIRTAGTLACWISDARRLDGAFADALIRPPSGRFTLVSAGSEVACGIRLNATLACWGDSIDNGGAATRAPNGEFVSVSVGSNAACGVHVSGTLACWGLYAVGPVPSGHFSQVTVRNFACGVRKRGAVQCWWSDGHQGPVPPPNRFRMVSAGRDFVCGVKAGGGLTCWGAVM